MTEKPSTPHRRYADAADSKHRAPAEPPDAPKAPPANLDLATVRAELALLADTEPEALLKGLMLECRELARGTANIICDPQFDVLRDDYFRTLKGAAEISAQLGDVIARLRQGPAVEERRQRIIVERVERKPVAAGEGVPALAQNE